MSGAAASHERVLASLVVPLWGRADRTLEFVQHLVSVTPAGLFELVTVDMGSADATQDVLAALSGEVHVLRSEAPDSFAAGANLGAKAACGRYLVFLDPSCVLPPGWLERTVAVLGSYAQVGAIGPAIAVGAGGPALWAGLSVEGRGDGGLSVLARYQGPARPGQLIPPQAPATALPSLALAVRREAFWEVGGFDEEYRSGFEDVDLCLRLRQAGWEVLCDLESRASLRGAACRPRSPEHEELDAAALARRWSGSDLLSAQRAKPTGVTEDGGWGANVVGYFEAELGIGESARLVVDAVEAAGGSCATCSYYRHYNRAEHPFKHRRSAAGRFPFDLNIVCLNGDMLPYWAAENDGALSGRYTVAVWHWELPELPPGFVSALELVDEVWAGSEFTRKAVAAATAKPVVTFPFPLPRRSGPPPCTRADVGLPEGFVFGFMFDANSTVERKNPDGLIRAFCRAFSPGEGPLLVVKVTNGERGGAASRLRALAEGRRDVVLTDRYLPPEQNAAWTGLVDCYVSLHRSEGFGLTIAEAMSWGTPVIATGYSGNLDFTTEDNAFLVPWAPATVPPGGLYPPGGAWAEPDLDAAARAMREVWEHPDEARARGERGQAFVQRAYSLQAAAKVVAERVAAIRQTIDRSGAAGRESPGPTWHAGPLPGGAAVDRSRLKAPLRLNVGAGDDRRSGYLSVDLRADVADVVADATKLPFPTASASELVASDVLEHFPASRTAEVLAEWRRVLAPGGKLTIRVPNLLVLAQILVRGGPEPAAQVVRNIYGGHRFGPDGAWDAHHTGWTPAMLHEELAAAGFLVMSDDGQPNNTVTAMRLADC